MRLPTKGGNQADIMKMFMVLILSLSSTVDDNIFGGVVHGAQRYIGEC